MKKTILLGVKNRFSTRTNQVIYFLNGLLFVIMGTYHIGKDIISPIGLILGILLILVGFGNAVYSVLAFGAKSKYAPRVALDEESILLKSSFEKPPVLITWDKIKQIGLSSYLIKFITSQQEYHFTYEANADTSISIKSAIREVAESKQIEVTGG